MFLEEIWFTGTPDSIGRIRGRFLDFLEHATAGKLSTYGRFDADYVWMRRVREQRKMDGLPQRTGSTSTGLNLG